LKNKKFALFNYTQSDPKGNTDNYGSDNIPSIDLTQIENVPIAIYVGQNDSLSVPADADWLK